MKPTELGYKVSWLVSYADINKKEYSPRKNKMLTVKNVIFVTNLNHGACLLFDRKGLGHKQTQKVRTQQSIKSFLQRFKFA